MTYLLSAGIEKKSLDNDSTLGLHKVVITHDNVPTDKRGFPFNGLLIWFELEKMHLERKWARGLMDKASDFESEDREFDPHQRQILFLSAKLLPVAKMQKI